MLNNKVIILSLYLIGYISIDIAYAYDNLDRIAIETILLEAQGESLEGQIAVGEVIRNRAIRGDLSHDQVCVAPRQFSCWNDQKQARNRLKQASGEVYQRASRAWAESEHSQLVGESTHYHADYTSPYWAKGKRPAYVIGRHWFYEGIK